MSDTVDQIKSKLDIVDVVAGYLKLQRAGINWKGRCPFHNEKTASFFVSPERQTWHCFGCNKGGDMFSFIQDVEGIEFVESMRILAAKAGVQVPEYHPQAAQERSRRQVLLAAAEQATQFFEHQLWNAAIGAKALEYLRGRGLTDDTIKAWRLGWAPNDWQALTTALSKQSVPLADAAGAGVVIEKNGRHYDRFRSRIMFPIADANGQVVGFTGRVFGAEVAVDGEPLAKYVNTPQTAIYDKGRVLFGLDKAKLEMRRRDACLLVEGNVDAILSWQAGATHVVATSGTALTSDQLRMLARYSTNLDFCFDTDQAGQVATRRGIGMALAQQFAVRIITVPDPECKDPADYVAKHGAAWNDAVSAAKPALQYYYDQAVASFSPASAESKKQVLASVGPLVRRLTSQVEQGHWVSQLASLLRADGKAIRADLAAMKDDVVGGAPEQERVVATPSNPEAPLDPLNLELLSLLARQPSLVVQVGEATDLADVRVAALIRNPHQLANPPPEYRSLVEAAHLRGAEWWSAYPDDQLPQQMAVLVMRLRERDIKAKRNRVQQEIRHVETTHDPGKLQALLAQFQDYSTELHRLQQSQPSTT